MQYSWNVDVTDTYSITMAIGVRPLIITIHCIL